MAKKEQVHKEAVANQAAAHFRWRTSNQRPQGAIDMDNRHNRLMGRTDIKRLQAAFPERPPPRPKAEPPSASAEQ